MTSSLKVSPMPAWVCAIHHTPLVETHSGFSCPHNHFFSVVRGIPRFVESEAYAEHFGLQWRQYPRTQLDSYTQLPISRDRLRRCLGEELWHRLRGMSVLECGCGAGRFTEVLLAEGAVVTSVDLSRAIETNADLFPVDERHRVAQADIGKLPFERGHYDLVLCLGVIQHTPSPERSIAELYSHVKPSGCLVIDHYSPSISRWTSAKPLFRAVMRRLPAKTALRCTEWLVGAFLPLHRRFKNSAMAWFLLCRISPITTYYHSVPMLPEPLQREWALLDTHDSLTDWYKHLRTPRQIRSILESLGAEEIWCEYGGNGVEARGRRPNAG